MRKILFVILLLMPLMPKAQDSIKVHKNELIIGVGSELFMSDESWDDGVDEKTVYPVFVGYMRRLNKTWSVGAYLNYFNHDESCWMLFCDSNTGISYEDGYWKNQKYIGLMASIKAKWARHRQWSFYSRLGIGPYLHLTKIKVENSQTSSDLHFGFQQITPLGFEIGTDKIRGFIEVGLGFQGVVNIGLSHSF